MGSRLARSMDVPPATMRANAGCDGSVLPWPPCVLRALRLLTVWAALQQLILLHGRWRHRQKH